MLKLLATWMMMRAQARSGQFIQAATHMVPAEGQRHGVLGGHRTQIDL
jgi:hypothetical protein